MATDAPQIPESRPSWVRVVLAMFVALASDAVGALFFPLEAITPPAWILQCGIDVLTALAIWLALGRPAVLLVALVIEAIPGVGIVPFWTVAVVAIAATGRLPARGNRGGPATTDQRLPPPPA